MFIYVLSTLFDVTPTGVVSYNPQISTLTQRNQQRNWQVLNQLLQLRAQPILITQPIVNELDVKYFSFGKIFSGKQKIWTTVWAVEQSELYSTKSNSLNALFDDFNQIPMLTGLEESVTFLNPLLETQGDNANICFYSEEQWELSKFVIDFDNIKKSILGK